jgi:rod shape-determining protein MreC
MKKLRISRFLFFLIVMVLSSLMLLFFLFRNSSVISTISSPVRTVVAKVDSIISMPFRFVSSANDNVQDLLNTYSENKKLKEQLSELNDQSVLVKNLSDENKILSDEINASSTLSSKVSLIGKTIVRSPVSWNETLTVNVGNDKGVKENMLALSGGGAIGIVSEVDSSTSSISLLSSGSQFNIPVKISTNSGDVYGLLESYNFEENYFLITDLNSSLTIEKDDSVVTSGLDGKTVSNISVGTVLTVETSSDSLNSKIYVNPTADFANISFVTIVGD